MVSQRRKPPWSALLGVVFTACALSVPSTHAASPFAWSPNGNWVCYVDQSPPAPAKLPVDWLFEPAREADTPPGPAPRASVSTNTASRSRLWATQVITRQSVLIEDVDGLIAAPTWSPDGRSLAFVRLIPSSNGRGKVEVMLRENGNRRILSTKNVDDWSHEVGRIGKLAIAWSPDGKYIVVPAVNPMGLSIYRIDTGRLIKSLDGAILPAWSPDGSKMLYVSTGDEDWLESLDSHFGASQHLADVGHLEVPPIFARDGQTVIALARARSERGAAPPSETVELWRIRTNDGKKERLTTIATTTGDQVLNSLAITADKEGENVYFAASISAEPCQVSLYPLRERSVLDKFPVLDKNFAIENLSLSPQANANVRPPDGLLAMRLNGLPLLYDLRSRQIVPLVPDADARAAWASLLLTNVDALIRDLRPSPIVAGRAIERPLAVPMPGELENNSDALDRFRRFGRIGHELSPEPNPNAGWPIAELIFDYLREDYPAALADLEAIESHEDDPRIRLRLLHLRAQIFAGLTEFDRARGTLSYLKSLETKPGRRGVEETTQGPSFSKITPRGAGWADYAMGRIAALEVELAKQESATSPIAPTDHRNFDAPQPGLGLDFPADPLLKNLGPLQIRPNLPNPPLPEIRPNFLRRPRDVNDRN